MFTGVFKDRAATRPRPGQTPDDVLLRLLQAKSLKPFRFTRRGEIGPFVVEYVCRERALVIELRRKFSGDETREQARTAFLNAMGYSVLQIARQDLLSRPVKILTQIRMALR